MVKKKSHIESLFRKTLWPGKREKYDIDFFNILEPQRVVSEHHRYKSGVFFSEKCDRDIQYESGIELSFINELEHYQSVLFYFEQPVKIPYWRGRRKTTYTPDFAVFLETKEVVIVEIKDLSGMLDNRTQMKIEALLDFCHKKGFGLLLTDGKSTFHDIIKIKSNSKLENTIIKVISEKRVLRKTECRQLMNDCNATQPELLKAITSHNLKFRSKTWKIEQDNPNILFHGVFIENKPYEDLAEEKYQTLFR